MKSTEMKAVEREVRDLRQNLSTQINENEVLRNLVIRWQEANEAAVKHNKIFLEEAKRLQGQLTIANEALEAKDKQIILINQEANLYFRLLEIIKTTVYSYKEDGSGITKNG